MSFVIIKKGEIVGPKAHHSSFDDDQLMKLCILMILCLISDRFMIKILVGVELQQRILRQVLELAPVDSRAYASRTHLEMSSVDCTWTKSRR